MTHLSRKGQLVVIIIAAAVFFCAGYHYYQVKNSQSIEEIVISSDQDAASAKKTKEIVVHVAGEVVSPGIYKLNEGARVIDAVNKAVASDNADLDQLNLAAYLADEQKVYVPPKRNLDDTMNQTTDYTQVSSGNNTAARLININTASQSELDSLPGIGPVLAERIVQYREKNGPFTSPEDLLNVSGIGEAKFSQIKDLISLY